MGDIPLVIAGPTAILLVLAGYMTGLFSGRAVMDNRIEAGYFVDNKTLYQIVKVETQPIPEPPKE